MRERLLTEGEASGDGQGQQEEFGHKNMKCQEVLCSVILSLARAGSREVTCLVSGRPRIEPVS